MRGVGIDFSSSRSRGLTAVGTVLIASSLAFAPAYAGLQRLSRTAPPALAVARAAHTATALADGTVLVIGGNRDGELIAEAELIDPSGGGTRIIARSIQARASHAATRLADGRVLVTGGHDAVAAFDSTEIYDPATRAFGLGPRMVRQRSGHTATLLPNGHVLISGGDAAGSMETYDPAREVFQILRAPLSNARSNHSTVTLQDGRVLAVGGSDSHGRPVATAELFDPTSGRATELPLRSARLAPVLRLLPDGKVQAIGGNGATTTMEMFSPVGYFTAEVRLPKSLRASGQTDSITATPESSAKSLPTPACDGCTRTDLGRGRIMISGGLEAQGKASRSLEFVTAPVEPWVTTDKTDYAPGSSVSITGGGFEGGESITLTITRDPEMSTERTTTFTLTADTQGDFNNVGQEFPIVEEDLYASFLVTAKGATSGRVAFTSFTDGPQSVGSVAIGAQSPASVAAGNAASYVVTVNRASGNGTNGDFTVTLSVTSALPAGVTASFSAGSGGVFTAPNQLSIASSANSGTATLTLATSSATPVNTPAGVSFTVRALNHASPQNRASGSGTLTVSGPVCTIPSVAANPSTQSIIYGANAVFTAAATGSPAPGVQWEVSAAGGPWTAITGATSAMLTLNSPAVSQSGNQYRATFTNSCGSVSTTAALLTVASATPTLTWATPAAITYGTALSAAQLNATASPSGGSFAYTPAAGTVLSAGHAQTLSVTYTPADPANYSTAFASVSIDVARASTTTTVSCPSTVTTYTGTAQMPCTASVTGAGGLNQPLSVNYSNNTNAGTATASASYAESANHLASSDEETFAIGKAASTTIVSCTGGPFTYTGAAQTPCMAAVTGAGGLSGSPAVSYVDNTNAGTATASASYAESANHLASSDEETFAIGKAASTTTVSCTGGPFTYTGAAQTPCTAAVTGAGGLNASVAVSYTNNINAGTASASATYAGDANHEGSTGASFFTIGKALSITVVACPASVVFTGAALTPCMASVTGAGGLDQTLTPVYSNNTNVGMASASASYPGDANHDGSGGNATFNIVKAPSTTTVTCTAGPFIYTAVAQTPCTAAVTGAGGLNQVLAVSYTNNTNVGTASASASYGGDANHNGSNGNATFTITAATAIVTYTGPAIITGMANKTGAGFTATVSASATVVLPVGTLPTDGTMKIVFISDEGTGCTAVVGTIGGDNRTGTATCTWKISSSNEPGLAFTVTANLDSRNYVGSDSISITVYTPGTNFITGGGYVILGSSSAGQYAGTANTKSNFGFNVKYNKSGTNLQGNLNLIIRRMESGVMRRYQIKGNAMTQLTVLGTRATFNGKANMSDITNPLAPVSLGGNLILQLDMTDNGEPGTTDWIALTVYNGDGGLMYSNSWSGIKSVEQTLNGGNLSIK